MLSPWKTLLAESKYWGVTIIDILACIGNTTYKERGSQIGAQLDTGSRREFGVFVIFLSQSLICP